MKSQKNWFCRMHSVYFVFGSVRVRTGFASLGVDPVTEAVMAVGVKVSGQTCQVGVNIRGVVVRVAGQVGEIKLDVTGVPTTERISHRVRNFRNSGFKVTVVNCFEWVL